MSRAQSTEPRPTSVNVRVSGALREHIERTASEGDYESVSEYVRDLIRKDKLASESSAFERVKVVLQAAFAAPKTDYERVSADDIRALVASRSGE